MSRGHGLRQRLILDALEKRPGKVIPLGGGTRSERAAFVRAATKLQSAGKCVIVRLWNHEHTALMACVAMPDAKHDGKPVSFLSVARVTRVTGATLTGSLRDMAQEFDKSHVQIWRDEQLNLGIRRRR